MATVEDFKVGDKVLCIGDCETDGTPALIPDPAYQPLINERIPITITEIKQETYPIRSTMILNGKEKYLIFHPNELIHNNWRSRFGE